MAVKTYKPTTPSRRQMTTPSFEEITKKSPEKSLIFTKKKNAGRNSYGKITVRHRGGGNKIKYRIIDFKRQNDAPATVLAIEYDPNRTAYIALIQYEGGKKAYTIAPVGLKVGDVIYSGESADIKPGNTLPISNIPQGTFIYNIELYPGKGAQLVRSAGTAAQLLEWAYRDKNANYLNSNEVRSIFIQLANRDRNFMYPNPVWGWGKLRIN